MNRITSFDGEHAFLSNFHPSPVTFEGTIYPTVEHAFQAAKTDDPRERAAVLAQATPGGAKRLGRRLTLRPDWDEARVPVMHVLVYEKFANHPDLAERLLATGDAELVEGNGWGDVFWGVCRGVGANNLGRILMQVRAQLREEAVRHG